MSIHPSAIVAPTASLGRQVVIGPYVIVEGDTVIGDGCQLDAHAVVRRGTQLGPNNHLHPFAVLGGSPQDKRHDTTSSSLTIGSDNEFREHVTVHRGTSHGGGVTRIGSGGLFMATGHIGHDAQVGDRVVLTNATLLGGHTEVADDVVLGGMVAVAPKVRIGRCAFVAGGAMVERHVPPFVIAAGNRARPRAINRVGLARIGVPPPSGVLLRKAFRNLYGRHTTHRQAAVALMSSPDPYVRELATFVLETVAVD